MIYRELGSSDIKVSVVGFGCSKLGSAGSRIGIRRGIDLVAEAVDKGINFFDTANIYGQGDSERILGRALDGRRDSVILLTKAGYDIRRMSSVLKVVKPVARRIIRKFSSAGKVIQRARAGALQQRFDSRYITGCLEESLRRFRTDYVDIFFLHSPPVEVLSRGEVFEELDKLKQDGKIRCYGFSMAQLAPMIADHIPPGIAALGTAVNPKSVDNIEQLPSLAGKGVGIFAYQPFGSGEFITAPSVEPCAERGKIDVSGNGTRSRMLIQDALEKSGVKSVVIGISSSEHLLDNIQALDQHPSDSA